MTATLKSLTEKHAELSAEAKAVAGDIQELVGQGGWLDATERMQMLTGILKQLRKIEAKMDERS